LDATIFNDLLNKHTAQISAEVEVEKEDKRIAKWTQEHKDKLAIETEVLGEQREKENEMFETAAKSPKKGIEKKDSVFEGERNFKKSTDMAEAVDPQEKALREARKIYVETEFKERNALREVRGYFSRALGKEDKTETPNIAAARMAYEKLRKEKMNGEIAKLESGTLKGDALNTEIKKLLTYYNTGAALELYNDRIAVKTAQKKETEGKTKLKNTWDKVTLKMDQVAEFYNKKVHWSIKIGLAATSWYLGAGAFKSGKNIWGAFMMATAGGAALDGAAQFTDSILDGRADKKNLKEISKEGGEVDFEKLRGILNQKNEDINRKVNKHVMRAYFNKTVAVCLATVIGVQAVEGMAHAFEKMTAAPPVVSTAPSVDNWPTPPSTGIPVDLKPESPEYIKWVAEHGGKPPVSAQDAAAQAKKAAETVVGASNKAVESLTIEKGSSIEKTLIDHLKTHGIKNPGAAAHRMWLDYMHDNKAEIIKKVGDNEYHKMLKDGMVNVKPGTHIFINENNPLEMKLSNIDGKISHLNGHHSVGSGGVENGQGVGASIKPTDIPKPSAAAVVGNADVLGYTGETQQNISTAKEMFKSANAEYIQAANDATDHPAGGGGPSASQYEDMGRADEARKSAALTVENLANAKENCFKDIKAATNGIYKATGYKWDDIKNLDYSSAYADDKLRPIMKEMAKEYKKEFGNTNNFPNSNTTFGKWLYRVKEVTIKKRLGINIE